MVVSCKALAFHVDRFLCVNAELNWLVEYVEDSARKTYKYKHIQDLTVCFVFFLKKYVRESYMYISRKVHFGIVGGALLFFPPHLSMRRGI